MKSINLKKVKELANDLFLEMSEEEYVKLLDDFTYLGEQAQFLENLPNIDEEEPLVYPFECTTTYLREDIEQQTPSQSEILSNAAQTSDGFVVLPKVVK